MRPPFPALHRPSCGLMAKLVECMEMRHTIRAQSNHQSLGHGQRFSHYGQLYGPQAQNAFPTMNFDNDRPDVGRLMSPALPDGKQDETHRKMKPRRKYDVNMTSHGFVVEEKKHWTMNTFTDVESCIETFVQYLRWI